jgi:spermidine synthase
MHGLNVSAVEIDPVVHQFAEDYFGLPRLRGTIMHEDGRKFIEQKRQQWDFIIHDVFSGGLVPEHLFTSEMWVSVKEKLKPGGILVVVLSCLFGNIEYGWQGRGCFYQGSDYDFEDSF